MSNTSPPLLLEREGAIATLQFNRPEAFNALDATLAQAFVAAMLNSQPMGFYGPAQLVQDAKRHGVVVLPPDVTMSDWDCALEEESGSEAKKMAEKMVEKMGSDQTYFESNPPFPLVNQTQAAINNQAATASNAAAVAAPKKRGRPPKKKQTVADLLRREQACNGSLF